MTHPSPGGTPPGSQPPAPSGPPGGPARQGGFDPRAVNPLDWAIAAVAVLAVIFSYISYYTLFGYSGGTGFVGFLAWLLGLIGAGCALAAYAAPNLRPPVPLRLVGTAAFGLALILSLLKMIARPGGYGIHAHIGLGLYVVTILYAVGTALSFVRFQQTGGDLQGSLDDVRRRGSALRSGSRTGSGPVSGTGTGAPAPQQQWAPPAGQPSGTSTPPPPPPPAGESTPPGPSPKGFGQPPPR
jgi:hypothetical protein